MQIGTTLMGMVNTTSHRSTNHHIAIWVLSNLEHLDYITEPEMAAACNVSKSSINRFCKELGFANFQQFQTEVLRFHRPYNMKYDLSLEEGFDPARPLLENYTGLVARYAQELNRRVDDAVLDEVAHDIDTFEQVVILGELQSGAVAIGMQHNLFSTGKVVTAYTYSTEQREILRTLEPGTLLIIFSLFGNFFHRIVDEEGVFRHPEGTKVVWITSQPALPPTIPIDVVIDCGLNKTLAAGNLAMELVANTIVLYYWQLHHTPAVS